MGLFDLFSKKSSDAPKRKQVTQKELSRLTRVASNKMSQNYDRQEAIELLGQMANAQGATALLKRFDFSMEPSIVDQDEKEAALEGIVSAGEAALEPVRAYCARAESLTWPLKVLRRIVAGEDEVVGELLLLLEQFDTEYLRNPEPKIQLVTLLAEFPSEEVRTAVEPFLGDVNESVRFHAVGTVLSAADPAATQPLVDALEEEESLRIKNRIARGLQERGWSVPEELAQRLQAALPPDYSLVDGRVQAS